MYLPTLLWSDATYVASCLVRILRVSELQQLRISVLVRNKEMGRITEVLFQTTQKKSRLVSSWIACVRTSKAGMVSLVS